MRPTNYTLDAAQLEFDMFVHSNVRSIANAKLPRLSLLEGKIGYFLGEIARRGA
jgi:hypothetical protein